MTRKAFWIPLIAMLLLAGSLAAALMHGGNPDSVVATPLIGEAAPPLDVPVLDTTGKLTLEALKGKPHLVNFFASWCGPCAGENPILMNLAKKHDVEIIGIAMKDNAQALEHYLQQRGNPYDTVALDDNGHTAMDWGVSGIPETFAIDANGMILDRYMGGLTRGDANRLVQILIQSHK
jgi:cytochrome c biogenesis protein CcmG/thiol:disulfide interchange protein DsbE